MTEVSLKHRLEYAALRMAVMELLQLPLPAGCAIARAAGGLAYRLLGERTRIGRENLRAAFPERSPEEIERLLESVYRNLMQTAAEILYFRRMVNRSTWRRYVELENPRVVLDIALRARGGILVGAHLGNWELLGHVMPYIGLKSQVLARPMDNPLVDDFVLGVRETGLQRITLKRGAGAEIEKTLSEGGFISILVDQDAGRKGAFVPFFGRPASTWRTPAILAMKTGAAILPGCCVRVEGTGRFRIIAGEPIYADPEADVTGETLRITAAFTRQLENWVRRYPAQYLWLHRRWKSVPGPRSIALAEEG